MMNISFTTRVASLFTGALIALSMSSIGATAATVAAAGTGTTGSGGFTLVGGSGVITDVVPHPAWANAATTPTSNWVWDTANTTGTGSPLTFSYQFDLTGYDAATALLSGGWSTDNTGLAVLNSTTIASLGAGGFASFSPLSAGSSSFLAGVNTLTFTVTDLGLPGGFRTSFTVMADEVSAVPLPAGGALLLTGVMGMAAMRKRKKG
jgi:hypothetical protein